MNYHPINLQDKLSKFSEHWSPKIIARMNDYQIKLAKVEGEFDWHTHPETDELFLVVKGKLEIHFRDGVISLNEGEMYVVPTGVEHKPVADAECHIMLIEPAGTVNTGNVVSDKTAPNDIWI
jgi:mannose-6-phosphate isomerase-like protein (cupin superfamily)